MAGVCDSCGEKEWRYKCPGCEMQSCSLACVKKHKSESGCQGRRCKTKFVSLSTFTTGQLLSDYHFLEDARRVMESAQRGRLALGRRLGDVREQRQKLQRVQSVARKRGTTLHLLAQGMVRHQVNTSCTVWNRDRKRWDIEWRVRLVFPQVALEYSEDRVCEDWLLGDILKRYIHPSESDPIIRHRLKCYIGKDIAVFLKLEKRGPVTSRYCQLQLQWSLTECLRHKTIIEFPEIHVVLSTPSCVAEYSPSVSERETRECSQEIETTSSPCGGVSSLQRLAQYYMSDGET